MGKPTHKEDYRIEFTLKNHLFVIEDANMTAGDKRIRRVGLIERMFKNREINERELGAADRFETDYFKSKLAPKYAQSSYGAIRGIEATDEYTAKIERVKRNAQTSVVLALAHVGTRAGALLEAHVGLGEPINAANGRANTETKALIAGALSSLVGFYKL